MFFRDIVGQEEAKIKLITEAQNKQVPHSLLLCGPEGVGKLPLAVALARYLLCTNPLKSDSCGTCSSCIKINKLSHPDLHFVFPVIKKRRPLDKPISDDYLTQWRELMTLSNYFGLEEWLDQMGAENQQAMIYSEESDIISEKLSLKSREGGYKIMIIWLPEKMNQSCANKILKLLEEPPGNTLFMLVSNHPELIIETILSRSQKIEIKFLSSQTIVSTLQMPSYGIGRERATEIANMSRGSWLKVIRSMRVEITGNEYLDFFIRMTRLAYGRNLKKIKELSDEISSRGREWQKSYLNYCQHMIRENFILNFHLPQLNALTVREREFSSNFSPFINEKNVVELMYELTEAQSHIEQNVNAKMVFFDFSLKLIMLLK